jgi:hypothetical protein
MEDVTGETFDGVEVETDGKTFTGCTFTSTGLLYFGGEHPMFESCTFNEGVSWIFRDAALKTIQFLQRINNDDGGEKFIADVFQKGKYYADQP